jgi:aminopeptidase N
VSAWKLAGETLAADRIQMDARTLTLRDPPASGTLIVHSEIAPAANVALEGLYLSSGVFCTQCEPEGFRRITYFPDRPDVLTRYTVTLRADRARYPVLLSNGNLVAQGELDHGRHFAQWHDPFPKPSYLFALVAGDLASLDATFTSKSGRHIELRIFSTAQNLPRCRHCNGVAERAFAWDEQRFGLEYDLDTFMIFCADDFNMGAMENKGLNIFNSRLVLANPATATDDDYAAIEGVIGHEYFHNWSGNRVTCRDWFQLSLKEGLTVFRDQEFSSDLNSRAVERIAAIDYLRREQFPEDAGPMAHNVRPDEYLEINNFYSATVYEKGAEVIRMQHTLLGPERFRRGIDIYFQRHDGCAVTCDDFIQAMQDASSVELGQFRLWYSQAGTPGLDRDRPIRCNNFDLLADGLAKNASDARSAYQAAVPHSHRCWDWSGRTAATAAKARRPAPGNGRHLHPAFAPAVTNLPLRRCSGDAGAVAAAGILAPVILDYDCTGSDLAFLALTTATR